MMVLTDAVIARRFLERALAHESKPALDAASVADLMTIAEVIDLETLAVSYTSYSLNKAAAVGWNWKSALTADAYDIGGGNGKTLKRDQWFEHCRTMSAAYGTGSMSVLDGGHGGSTSEISSIGVISSTAAATGG